TVPQSSAEAMCLCILGCPSKGLSISGRDHAITASASPIVNSVPIRRPSLPSRAISMDDSREGARIPSGQFESLEQMTSNNNSFVFLDTSLLLAIQWLCPNKTRFREGSHEPRVSVTAQTSAQPR